jgi:hypothetical protein
MGFAVLSPSYASGDVAASCLRDYEAEAAKEDGIAIVVEAPCRVRKLYLKLVETSLIACAPLILMNLIWPCAAASAFGRSTLRID